ncbi:MAG TPA: GDSL-type esterase/lipase family protein [Tepidisphaeraceae bacterium]|nr:GDSL-type esterase/lipase family protein [Tepidisphaeraceae bacterium]
MIQTCPFIAIAAVVLAPALANADVLNRGTLQWAKAAESGRADMLILGDSVVLSGGDGWDAGFNTAAGKRYGLAGSGLMRAASGDEGDGVAFHTVNGTGWTAGRAAMPTAARPYAWGDTGFTVATGPAANLNLSLSPGGGGFDPRAAYDWTVYGAGLSTDSAVGAYRRFGSAPYTRIATATPTAFTADGNGFGKATISFASNALSPASQEFRLEGATQTSYLYSRLHRPNATGVTVTSWGYGGKDTRDFLNDQYLGGFGSAAGRLAWLGSIVDGGSGKLNIVIAEGFNDRNDNDLSVDGVNAGKTPEGFAANVQAIIAATRDDWAAKGKDEADLSFTLLGMYEIASHNEPLRLYAAELEKIALADQQITFVDLYTAAPGYAAANSMGYLADGLHPTRAGALAYSQIAFNAMVPEPASVSMLVVAASMLLRCRQRRQR